MEVLGIIPARYNSSRFPGKVLADLNGKPLIQHVYERAKHSATLDDLVVAADDPRVVKAVEKFGGKAILTSKEYLSGTDRLREVASIMESRIIINIQGDEPLIHRSMIDSLAQCLLDDNSIPMATLIKRIDNEEELNDPNVVKVVVDKLGFALYFSRRTIPYLREPQDKKSKDIVFYKHIGLYAYTRDFLFTFNKMPPTSLEKAEKLEQLRALEHGYKIKTIETNFDTIGVDTPQDLEKVKEKLRVK